MFCFPFCKVYEHIHSVFNRDLVEHGHLFEGWVKIAKNNMNKPIPYKYYVLRGEEGEYEFIYKVCHEKGVHVNRCMFIQSDELSGTGKKLF